MNPAQANKATSVRARLLNVAKAQGVDFQQVLVRFALERMLYRLSQSPHANRFLLKGALLFTLWYAMPHRATRDADLLGFGASDLASVADIFREIAAIAADDGIAFDPASVTVEAIRKDAGYGGVRVIILGMLANARCKTQIDVGFGDAVTPAPVNAVYPVLLDDLPAPHLRTYPSYTVIAEKLHAIATLGMSNSRLKDYFDLSVLLERETLENDVLIRSWPLLSGAARRCPRRCRLVYRTSLHTIHHGRRCGERFSKRTNFRQSRCQKSRIGCGQA